MAIYYGVGNRLVPEQQYLDRVYDGTFSRLAQAAEQGLPAGDIEVAGHRIAAAAAAAPVKPDGTPFTPIALGKPLTVEIRWVYTGRFPKTSFGHKSKDMLIASAFKSSSTFDAAPRAVNLVRKNVRPHTDVLWAATEKGTPLAFYTSAVTDSVTLATIEIVFDEFPDDAVRKLGDAFGAASGIPVFAPQSIYFLAASYLLKLTAQAGHSLFDGDIAFKATEQITFFRPGGTPSLAGWCVLTQGEENEDFRNTVQVGKDGQLFTLDANPKPYSGDVAYVVISLDGTGNSRYEEFTPTAVSAALLDQFFAVKDGQEQALDTAVEALKVYSDFRFRIQADALQKRLDKMGAADPDREATAQQLAALKKNILHPELQGG